jgi:hypothetical protein
VKEERYSFMFKHDYIYEGKTRTAVHESNSELWMDLLDEFYKFLLGCGFNIDRKDFNLEDE